MSFDPNNPFSLNGGNAFAGWPTGNDMNYGAPVQSAGAPVMTPMGLAGASYTEPSFALNAPATNVQAPQEGMMGRMGGWLSDGRNLGTVMGGVGTLAQAWLGFQQMQAAKDALNFQKTAFNANLNNQMKTYNNSLEDRIRGRTSDYAGKENDVQAYLSKHQLVR